LKGKNGYKWSSSPFITGKTKERNIVRSIPGPKGKAKYTPSPLEIWELFFTEEIISDICKFTNQEID
jgi:hypothetical protein